MRSDHHPNNIDWSLVFMALTISAALVFLFLQLH